MDRRIFLKSLLGVVGVAAAASVLTSQAEASPLLAELQSMDAKGTNPLTATSVDADLPAEGAVDAQFHRRRRFVRPMFRNRVRPNRMRRCRTFVNRRGRVVQRCTIG